METTQDNLITRDASNKHFDDDLLAKFAETFYGYGDYNAPYWFVGMEEGGGKHFEDVERRLSVWQQQRRELEDVAEFHRAIGFARLFDNKPILQPTWNKLIRILLSAEGQDVQTEQVREYQRDSLGRVSGGKNCLIELLPLPSPGIKDWTYTTWSYLPQLKSREEYKEHYMCDRAKHIQERIDQYRPRVVVFYSTTKEYMECWEYIAGASFPSAETGKTPYIARRDGMLFVVTSHPATKGLTNEYFHGIGQSIAQELGR